MALTTTNLIDWTNDLNLSPEDLVNILVGTGVEVISDSIRITQLPVEDNTDSQTVNDSNDSAEVDDVVITEEDIPATTVVLDNGPNTLVFPLTLNIDTNGANGTATVHNDGTITYTPNLDFYGYDDYTYIIDDGNGGTNSATVNVQVNPDSAVADFVTTDEDTPALNIAVSDNDLDLEFDKYPYTVSVTNDAANGTAIVNADDTITYTPNPDFFGTDSYTYTIDDGNGGTSSTTVAVWVQPNNLVNNIFLTGENTGVIIGVVNGDLSDITITDGSNNGITSIDADGIITYTPNPDFFGTDSYTYTIDDGNDGIRSTTVSVTVQPEDTLVDDFFLTNENNSVTSAVIDKLTFPTDGINETASVSADGTTIETPNGIASINRDGTINYFPNRDFNGVDSYAYTVNY